MRQLEKNGEWSASGVDERLSEILHALATWSGWFTVEHRLSAMQRVPRGPPEFEVVEPKMCRTSANTWHKQAEMQSHKKVRYARTVLNDVRVVCVKWNSDVVPTPLHAARRKYLQFLRSRVALFSRWWNMPKDVVRIIFSLYDANLKREHNKIVHAVTYLTCVADVREPWSAIFNCFEYIYEEKVL